jgi:hypothetical protein
VPESFKVLVRELNSLCLSIEAKGEGLRKDNLLTSEEGEELAEVMGAETVATGELAKSEGGMGTGEASGS